MYQPLVLSIIICLIGLAVAPAVSDDTPDFEKAFITCLPKFPSVDLDVFNNFCEPSFKTSNNDTKCLIKCVGEETGHSSTDGKLIISKFLNDSLALAELAKFDAGVANCTSLVKADACDTAYEQWNCYCALE